MILHIAPTPFFSDRGCHIRIEGIVHSLKSLDEDSEVCTYHLGYNPDGIITHRISPIRGYKKTSAGPSIYKPWADLKLAILATKHIRKNKPDALHAHLHEGVLIALLSRLLALQPALPIVADMQGSLVGELETYGFFNKLPWLKFPFKLLERFTLRFATQIVCSSEHALSIFASYPNTSHKLQLAQDGANLAQPVAPERKRLLQNKLGLHTHKLCVVYSGALIESKGLNELQELLLCCKDHHEQLSFLIIGYPTEELETFVATHKLDTLCTLTGRLPFNELHDYLALGDVAIDTKSSEAGEGSGKMLNYLASALPVVAFHTLNNVSFLGEDATLCRSVDEMKQQLLHYATDADQRQHAALRNRQRFIDQFSWDVTASQLGSTYRALGIIPTPEDSQTTANTCASDE